MPLGRYSLDRQKRAERASTTPRLRPEEHLRRRGSTVRREVTEDRGPLTPSPAWSTPRRAARRRLHPRRGRGAAGPAGACGAIAQRDHAVDFRGVSSTYCCPSRVLLNHRDVLLGTARDVMVPVRPPAPGARGRRGTGAPRAWSSGRSPTGMVAVALCSARWRPARSTPPDGRDDGTTVGRQRPDARPGRLAAGDLDDVLGISPASTLARPAHPPDSDVASALDLGNRPRCTGAAPRRLTRTVWSRPTSTTGCSTWPASTPSSTRGGRPGSVPYGTGRSRARRRRERFDRTSTDPPFVISPATGRREQRLVTAYNSGQPGDQVGHDESRAADID